MGAHACYIYVRGEFIREREHLQAAVDQAYEAKLVGKDNINGWPFDIYVTHGAGAYICGEETALLESLEGKKGMPRLKPPFPPMSVSTAVRPPSTMSSRSRWRRISCGAARRGSPPSAGPTMSAQAVLHLRSCRAALQRRRSHGDPFRELIERHCGGIRGGWDNLKAVIPGGSSVRMVPAEQIIDTPMDFDSLGKLRSVSAPPP